MFDWQDIQIFAALATSGSLAGAARSLGVTHATVGRRISALEQTLGVKLVDRLPRHSPLTEAGKTIASLATEMDGVAQRIARQARGASAALTGTVTITAPPSIASDVIAPRLASLRTLHPGLAITLAAQQQVVSLDRGEADIAIRLVKPEQPAHVVRVVGEVAFGLYAASELAALPPERWSFIAYDSALAHMPQQRWLDSYVQGRPIVFRSSDAHAQLAAARHGIGVAAIPVFLAEGDDRLLRVDPASAPPPRTIWLVIHADVRKAPAMRATADHLVQIFTSDPRFRAARTVAAGAGMTPTRTPTPGRVSETP